MAGSSRRRALAGIVVGIALTACSPSGGTATAPGGTKTRTAHPKPRPVKTIVRSGPTIAAGASGVFRTSQRGVGLRLTASRPSVSRSRLSSSYGYGPQHGYYVSFRITVRNIGRLAIPIGPSYFVARIPKQGTVTTESGNAPYSGASSQLDNTQLDAGQVLRGLVTFDVRAPHGLLSFAPDGSPALSWRF